MPNDWADQDWQARADAGRDLGGRHLTPPAPPAPSCRVCGMYPSHGDGLCYACAADIAAGRRVARRKVNGRCQDCGYAHKPTRVVRFWVNYMPYRVCAECERPYRGVILWPVRVDQQ